MSLFRDDKEVYACIGGLLEKVREEPSMAEELASAGMVMRVNCREPDAVITLDARDGAGKVEYGPSDAPADVELTMNADVAHRLWLGELDVVSEVLRGRIGCRGPLPTLSHLRRVLKPARLLYPEHLRDIGYAHLVDPSDAVGL